MRSRKAIGMVAERVYHAIHHSLVLASHLASMQSSTGTSETMSTGTKTQETGARYSVDLQVQQTTSNYVYTPNVHTLQSQQI